MNTTDSNSSGQQEIPFPVMPKRQISRDEMNLAEFPLTVLSTRSNPKIKTLEFTDSITTKNGQVKKRSWIITGADKFGLPTSSDDEVLLGLLKLTVDDGIREPKVFFTRYELLKILRWTTEGRSYTRLQNALDRLSGVRIKATNAFFDNESKSHSTKNFGILDAYEINDGRDSKPKPSFFIWSEELFNSFRTGFIKKLDLDFYLVLNSAISKRLYRYLDKHFWYKAKVKMGLFTLAHEKIGVSRNYKYASSIRQQLDPALQELIKVGFLAKVEYVGRGKGTEIVLYAARGKPRSQAGREEVLPPADGAGDSDPGTPAGDQELFKLLTERGLEPKQVARLLDRREPGDLDRIRKIVNHFDSLVAAGSTRVSKSPLGFLYWAVENFNQYVLPDDPIEKKEKESPALKEFVVVSDPKEEEREAEYKAFRTKELARLRETVEPYVLEQIEREVKDEVDNMKISLSEKGLERFLASKVEDRLAKLFVLPTREEWEQLH